jgi:aspartyl-tRNA(Asn)/glutamyl-tRNA(Gln) amidotransferase subunit A
MAAAAVGTDTGGSCRIPAALCGCVGYKPTARRVPSDGAYPLSPSLDSIGSLAHTVACCAILDAVLAAEPDFSLLPLSIARLRLAIPRSYVFEGISAEVAEAFERAVRLLSRAGATIDEIPFEALKELADFYRSGGIAAAEAYAWHRKRIESSGAEYDPRVANRIMRAREQGPNDYIELLMHRRTFIERVTPTLAAYDALLMPTVPIVAPRIEALTRDEDYVRLNALILRNSSAVNFMDGCAISIPCHDPAQAPVGLTLFSGEGRDRRLLSIAAAAEECLQRA